jgi:hypothetical protein
MLSLRFPNEVVRECRQFHKMIKARMFEPRRQCARELVLKPDDFGERMDFKMTGPLIVHMSTSFEGMYAVRSWKHSGRWRILPHLLRGATGCSAWER